MMLVVWRVCLLVSLTVQQSLDAVRPVDCLITNRLVMRDALNKKNRFGSV